MVDAERIQDLKEQLARANEAKKQRDAEARQQIKAHRPELLIRAETNQQIHAIRFSCWV